MSEMDNVTISFGAAPAMLSKVARDIGGMFYLHDPAESTFQYPSQVPKYFQNAWPYFFAFMIIENIVLWIQKKPTARLNDSITSISHGLFLECGRILCRGSEAAAYIYLYEKFRLVQLDWQSPVTWYLAVLGVDFCYYWVHRANHEVTILWAQHQVHHSSDEFNLAVGLRQSILQSWCSFAFYLPLALFIPPSHFLVHQQFNLLYQFWIHTRVVESLGPLEWILNTPKHHRVHHGCNIHCIDCNYGGLLIIWDRLFGTFVEDKPKEDIVYGLVFSEPSFNPLFLQVFYNKNVYNKWCSMEGWKNKLEAMVKGPSWVPGAPWKGRFEDRIDIRARDKYDVVLPAWCNMYLALHFMGVLWAFHKLFQHHLILQPATVLVAVVFILFSLTSFGMLFDDKRHAGLVEAGRCLLLLAMSQQYAFTSSSFFYALTQCFFAASAALWILQCLRSFSQSKSKTT